MSEIQWLKHSDPRFKPKPGDMVACVHSKEVDKLPSGHGRGTWFTADGEAVPQRDGYFLLFRLPGEGPRCGIQFPALDGTEFCYIPIPEKQVKPLQGIGLDEPQVFESDLTGDWVCRSCSSCKRGIWVIKAEHPDKETAIEMHNTAIEVRNAKAAGDL